MRTLDILHARITRIPFTFRCDRTLHLSFAALMSLGAYAALPPCDPWTLKVTTDAMAQETTWRILDATDGSVVASGGPYFPMAMTVTETVCLPQNGCFNLVVNDAGSNGITGGGFVLADPNGRRVVDNTANGHTFTAFSQAPLPFCDPVGTDRLIEMQQDQLAWYPTQVMYASENAAVSAQWNIGDQTDDGYQFWFFDPNGGYSRRIFRSHAADGGMGVPAPARATKLSLTSFTTSPPPQNVLLNVRVRGRVNGMDLPWGPATRFMIDIPTANCMPTHLIDIPGYYQSCGRVDVRLDGTDRIWAVPVNRPTPAGPVQYANRYRFRFENIHENFVRVITLPTYWLTMGVWSTAPLQPGNTYSVTVQASYDAGATWCPAGRSCLITIHGALGSRPEETLTATANRSAATCTLWPNPSTDGTVDLRITDLNTCSADLEITVMDPMGRMIQQDRYPCSEEATQVKLVPRTNWADGLYIVSIRANEEIITKRLVVQR